MSTEPEQAPVDRPLPSGPADSEPAADPEATADAEPAADPSPRPPPPPPTSLPPTSPWPQAAGSPLAGPPRYPPVGPAYPPHPPGSSDRPMAPMAPAWPPVQAMGMTPGARAGGVVALCGSVVLLTTTFFPWVDTSIGVGSLWDMFEGAGGATAFCATLLLTLVGWNIGYFGVRLAERRIAWATLALGVVSSLLLLLLGFLSLLGEARAGLGAGFYLSTLALVTMVVGYAIAWNGNTSRAIGHAIRGAAAASGMPPPL